ncbi:MAG: 5'-nucleotidase C-terminal domain-containing protein [Treponema sp.]|nr:5'-nucleotidase C-terminal domain-containing protein [Treponema sp.]
MKKIHNAVFFAVFFLWAGILFCKETTTKKVDILFTHDVHSQLDREAKAALLVKKEQKKNPDVFFFDAGDFSMGTLYQMLYTTEAAELRILGMAGTDVTTLGNHEFDYGSYGLYDMLESAKNCRGPVPRIVLANADWEKSGPGALVIKQAFDDYGVKPYVVVEKGGVRIAVFGIFGKNALFCAPTCEVAFAGQSESAEKIVSVIKAEEKPDMIVCLSHSGTNVKKSKSEDEILAENVPSIDLIVSGHSHTTLAEPVVHGNTCIVSCGAYSENIGHVELEQNNDGRWNVVDYTLIPVTDRMPEDAELQTELESFRDDVDTKYLSRYNLRSDEILAQNSGQLSETDAGYVMADCVRTAVKQLETVSDNSTFSGTGRYVDFVCIPSGLLRGTYASGPVTVADVFQSFSLGIGPDGYTGYPLVSVWVTGKDIKSVTELDASLSPFMDTVSLYFSGLAFTYNPHRFIFNKVEKAMTVTEDGTETPLVDNKLYRCIIDIYTARMMKGVVGVTKGMVQIVPRDAQGNPVTDFTKQIVYAKSGELKGWYAIAYGLREKRVISGYSGRREKMKLRDSSWAPAALFLYPSHFAVLVYSISCILTAVCILLIVLVVRLKRKRKQKQAD